MARDQIFTYWNSDKLEFERVTFFPISNTKNSDVGARVVHQTTFKKCSFSLFSLVFPITSNTSASRHI